MVFKIENEFLAIQVKSLGAELTSIVKKQNGEELLWQGDDKFWPRQAPILFPFVGRLKGDTYSYNGISYEMKQHGFARNMEFKVLEQSNEVLVLGLSSSQETKTNYPFDFQFKTKYELKGNTLFQSFEIINSGSDQLLYSVGGHPAFAIKQSFNEYQLTFNQAEPELQRTLLDGGLRFNQEALKLKNDREIDLDYQLFETDALVFEQLNSTSITLFHESKKLLTMVFNGFPYFGIWTKPGAPFLCLEPWFGIADKADSTGKIEEKQGISKLDVGESNSLTFSMEFH